MPQSLQQNGKAWTKDLLDAVAAHKKDKTKKMLGHVSRQYTSPFYKMDGMGFLPKEKARKKEGLSYQESISPDPDVLGKVINRLGRDLESSGINKYEANDILVCLDEGLTNAVLETMKNTRKLEDAI